MGVLDVLAQRLEARADEIADAFELAMARGDWRAAEAWVTRVHGKPVERVETSNTELTPAERDAVRTRLMEQYPELRAVA